MAAPFPADGPERLPAASGNVRTPEFRDPDGHPLELLGFPTGERPRLGGAPDQGAIAVSALIIPRSASPTPPAPSLSTERPLGLRATARSLNVGPKQARLDESLSEPRVDVTALSPARKTPHVELLCYRSVVHGVPPKLRNNDIAATRLVFETSDPTFPPSGGGDPFGQVDGDGHHLLIVPPANGPGL